MKKLFAPIVLVFLFSCSNDKILTKDKIEVLIDNSLSVSSSKKDIEGFLNKQKWIFSFDDSSSRYQIITPPGISKCRFRNPLLSFIYDCEIQIYIYVDEKENYSKRDVVEIYSGL